MSPKPDVRPGAIWAAFIALVAVGALVSFNIWYTNHAMRVADLRWCAMMVGLDNNYKAAKPGDLEPRQQVFAKQVSDLRQGLHCPNPPEPVPSR